MTIAGYSGTLIQFMKEVIKIIIYVVKSGDSLYSIGKQYGVDYEKMAKDNEISLKETLVIGQTIVIMDAGDTKKIGNIEVNGYAFPTIENEVLIKTLPNLTYLSIFSYEILSDGSLKSINDQPLIDSCRIYNVTPIMVISNINAEEGFSSDLVHNVLNSSSVQDKLINEVINIMKAKGYKGLDVDFEYIYPNDKTAYNNFISKIRAALKLNGYLLITAVAPKTSAEQMGLLYEAHDYKFHGSLVDHIILMTYEWGHTYSEPRAVAPLPAVIDVLDYAFTAIPSQKILMGIPNYGYDWKIPYQKGVPAKSVGNYEAVGIARINSATIEYDQKDQAPFFNYYDNNQGHEVWFEDARSIEAKLLLIPKYNLSGVSYWTITKFFPQNWLVLNSFFNVIKNSD